MPHLVTRVWVRKKNNKTESEVIDMFDASNVSMTDDTLQNILTMAPMLDEAGQNKVFGLICGLVAGAASSRDGVKSSKNQPDRKTG